MTHYGQQPPQGQPYTALEDRTTTDISEDEESSEDSSHTLLSEESIKPPSLSFSKGLLWKIIPQASSDQTAPSYIFGTIHSEDSRVLRIPEEVQQALQDSARFCMELIPDLTASTSLAQRMVYTDGQNLQDVIGEPLFNQLASLMSKRGIPEQALMIFKPWAVYMTLSMPQARTGVFLDLLLYEEARQQDKPTCGLETAEEQVDVFEETPLDDQVSLLQAIVKNPGATEEQIEKIIPTYLERDLSALQSLSMDLSDVSPQERRGVEMFLSRLIDDRNRKMVERMLPTLEEDPTFFAVGALHLPGSQGILQLLTDRGYKVSVVY